MWRKFFIGMLIFLFCTVPAVVTAQNIGFIIEEEDGSPSRFIYKLIVTSGTLSITGAVGTLTISGVGSVATDTIWDAAGDLVYGTGANTAARLAAGTANYVLQANGAAAPTWSAVTGTGNVVRATSPTLVTPVLGAASATTLDTGQGANELYDMDQNVQTTDNVTFGSVTATNGVTCGATALPAMTAQDSGNPGADKEIGKIYWDYVDGADGAENGDFFLQAMQDGSEATYIQGDESDDQIEMKKKVDFEGGTKSMTPMTDTAANFLANFTGANLYGGTFICSTAGTIQLPVMAVGMNFTIITAGNIAVVIDTNAADGYLLDGVHGVEGANLTNLSTAGDIAVLQYYTADDWLITTNGWTPE